MNKKIILLCFTLTLALNAEARTAQETLADLNTASDKVVEVYTASGMMGLRSEIEDCYDKHPEQLPVCIYIDIGSKIIDDAMVSAMKFPQNPFFTENLIQKRLASAYDRLGMTDIDDQVDYSKDLYYTMQGILIKKMQDK